MKRILRTFALLAATVGAISAFIAPSATATTIATTETPQVVIYDGAADPVSDETPCPIVRGGQTGLRICGYAWFDISWSDGRRHTFVVGMNHSVYNIIEYAGGGTSGWRSLGGQARYGVYLNYVRSRLDLSIWVVGLDGLVWCRDLSGSWNAWHHCA